MPQINYVPRREMKHPNVHTAAFSAHDQIPFPYGADYTTTISKRNSIAVQ